MKRNWFMAWMGIIIFGLYLYWLFLVRQHQEATWEWMKQIQDVYYEK